MFPILQYFYKHTSLEEVVPQTAYSCESKWHDPIWKWRSLSELEHFDLSILIFLTSFFGLSFFLVLIVALLGFRNHIRFNRLIKISTGNGKKKDRQVTSRLAYFRDMNLLLSVALVAFGGGMFILCIDGFTTNKVINSHKFAADLLICNTNISSIFLWLIIVKSLTTTLILCSPLLTL
jgi:hypothetical protein